MFRILVLEGYYPLAKLSNGNQSSLDSQSFLKDVPPTMTGISDVTQTEL
jgi:hypothetical protein